MKAAFVCDSKGSNREFKVHTEIAKVLCESFKKHGENPVPNKILINTQNLTKPGFHKGARDMSKVLMTHVSTCALSQIQWKHAPQAPQTCLRHLLRQDGNQAYTFVT